MHKLLKLSRTRLRAIMIAAAATVMVVGNVASVSGAALTSASLTLDDPRSSETTVNYDFAASNFTGATTIRCLELEFDTQADGAGGKPAGMDLTGAALGTNGIQAALTTQAIDDANGILQYTDAAGGTPSDSNIDVDGVTNPSTEDEFFLLATTYTDASCTGGNEVDSTIIAWHTIDGEAVQLVIEPNLQFVCNAVIAAQSVNGATTSHPSTATAIDYNNPVDVTTSANGISAHDIDVTTNASGGYVVYIRHTGDFQNAATDVIDAWTGTNAVPTVFPGVGTEAWGYTTEDSSLTGGAVDRFTSTPSWAGFTATNEPLVDNPAATAGTETTRVGHQVGIAADTPAGTYNTEIVYTIVATF